MRNVKDVCVHIKELLSMPSREHGTMSDTHTKSLIKETHKKKKFQKSNMGDSVTSEKTG